MKKYILSMIPFVLAMGCVIAYNIIGSEVAADGTLIEPFFLIPIGYIFVLVSMVSLIISGLISIKNYYKKIR
ncbi:DUF3955 domain-containing protein [Clostridium botulinum]|uniref:DUF3955 domain-containing protein n=1 Tax=Clostridium botulinum TaxID=1491 RepID=A0A6B4JQ40_CLOBO|nr:DUF3955 domain-containing protein [Clostridium botulinum]EES48155.1 putative lipoprotein [Clostridium botulinum E1 str. 'BoNT E Beluga']MBY6759401.1 DUF3955 domain-containing protein [Clostridium botulinum]MBY6918309.1 DUF3955 domain-containing protein [Clostridium botulinum]MCR1129393.1 DUF3955 domain-containing protein [Clostridium botulinum]NFJ59186.1 DUF3955 domain-containing protein [Clostridium botulinum]